MLWLPSLQRAVFAPFLAVFFLTVFFLIFLFDAWCFWAFLLTFLSNVLALCFVVLTLFFTDVTVFGAVSVEVDTAGAASAVLENNTSNAATDNFKFFIAYFL
ncbi:conserved protein of unknown function [Xenorhabdus poinarii G6]|uniref:Uncharacterized protein n=1 Tax=Xenorhabdus poinarii G6 TaxID=1354304 RepID=A0A068QYT7_9GAMM|nr:conserved protein of unknown function [Xenorhabdus poinarii G6]